MFGRNCRVRVQTSHRQLPCPSALGKIHCRCQVPAFLLLNVQLLSQAPVLLLREQSKGRNSRSMAALASAQRAYWIPGTAQARIAPHPALAATHSPAHPHANTCVHTISHAPFPPLPHPPHQPTRPPPPPAQVCFNLCYYQETASPHSSWPRSQRRSSTSRVRRGGGLGVCTGVQYYALGL